MHELDVLPVKRDPDRPNYRDVHPNILKPPFRIALIGSSKSGKTNLLMNYLRHNYYGGSKQLKIKPSFTKIIVFSPNLGLDSTSRALQSMCDPGDMHQNYEDGYINALIDYQKSKEGADRDRVLIIADDLLALGCSQKAAIFQGFSYFRHLDISIFVLTQIYKGQYSLPPSVRNNLEGLVFFRCPSQKQVEGLAEDIGDTFGSKDNVKNMLEYTTAEPYSFCFFNYRDLKVYKRHSEHIWSKYDENGNYSPLFTVPKNINRDKDKAKTKTKVEEYSDYSDSE